MPLKKKEDGTYRLVPKVNTEDFSVTEVSDNAPSSSSPKNLTENATGLSFVFLQPPEWMTSCTLSGLSYAMKMECVGLRSGCTDTKILTGNDIPIFDRCRYLCADP